MVSSSWCCTGMNKGTSIWPNHTADNENQCMIFYGNPNTKAKPISHHHPSCQTRHQYRSCQMDQRTHPVDNNAPSRSLNKMGAHGVVPSAASMSGNPTGPETLSGMDEDGNTGSQSLTDIYCTMKSCSSPSSELFRRQE